MNTTYRCPLGLTSHALSAWRDHLLSASERERIGVHVRACEACQRQLEAFEQLAQPLRAERVPQPDERLWGAVSAAMVRARGGRGRMGEDMSTG